MDPKGLNALVRGIYNSDSEVIPLHSPKLNGSELAYLQDVVDSTFVSSVGKFVNKCEDYCASYTKIQRAVAVVNGTAALQVAIRLVGVRDGDEVITQALSFVATANAIAYNGAVPVFVDVDIDTMGMSPVSLEKFLEQHAEQREGVVYNKGTGRRISAVLPMHTFGFLCRIEEINRICSKWGLALVEDSAEALGSFQDGKSAGSFGEISAFSFNGNKIITSGGGGMIVTNNDLLANRAKHITTTSKTPHPYEYFHDEIGYNFRMPNLNAALLLAQFERLETFKSNKSKIYKLYQEGLGNLGLDLVPIPETTSIWNHWLFAIRVKSFEEREKFIKGSAEFGITTRPIWKLLYKLPMYSSCQKDNQYNAEILERTIINIPSSSY